MRKVSTGAVLPIVLALALVATACSSRPSVVAQADLTVPTPTVAAEPTFRPTPSPDAAPSTVPFAPTVGPSPVATAAPTVGPTATPQPPGPCEAGPLALPNPDRPVYFAEVDIDPVAGTVLGSLTVGFTPDLATSELYLRLWPNGPRTNDGGVSMVLSDTQVISHEGGPVEMVAPTTARIALDQPLEAGETVTLSTSFELLVPGELQSRISGADDFMRLGTILPLVPWEPGRGWALDEATSLFAEAVSSPVADYEVRISVPEGFDVLASGIDDGTGLWKVQAARDFAISIGNFRTVTGVALAPDPVQVTVGVHTTMSDDADAYLAKIIASLEQFSERWGQYPWPSLTFALTPGLPGGIEFPTHIMQGPNTLGRTTSHEIGHMFFYSLVGNNQGAEPWLDEGLASYAEFTYEGVGAGAYPIPAGGVGNATQPMTFWESRSDIYYRSVYGQTGFALLQLGSRADVDCALARYVAQNAHRIATADDFVAAFEPTFPDVVSQLASFGVNVDG